MLSSSASRREVGGGGAASSTKSGELSLSKVASVAIRESSGSGSGGISKSSELLPRAGTMAAAREAAAAAVHHEGWMVRYGRRKIGRSFFHTRYFVLDSRLLAYYKKKPKDNMVPALTPSSFINQSIITTRTNFKHSYYHCLVLIFLPLAHACLANYIV